MKGASTMNIDPLEAAAQALDAELRKRAAIMLDLTILQAITLAAINAYEDALSMQGDARATPAEE